MSTSENHALSSRRRVHAWKGSGEARYFSRIRDCQLSLWRIKKFLEIPDNCLCFAEHTLFFPVYTLHLTLISIHLLYAVLFPSNTMSCLVSSPGKLLLRHPTVYKVSCHSLLFLSHVSNYRYNLPGRKELPQAEKPR